ncbi:cation-translocating P-type ATPase [Actinokineospora iranica]|nr:cation-translocating P-type ATPase [Actinokineospora iranica]
MLKGVTGLPLLGLALAAPARALRAAGEATSTALSVADEAVGLGRRVAVTGSRAGREAAAVTGRLVRDALTRRDRRWQTGSLVHVPLSLPGEPPERAREPIARAVAAVLDHPDVLSAYWDGGLARLVVRVAEDAAGDRVADEVSELAQRHGLAVADPEPRAHPGDLAEIRTSAIALALATAGLTAALTGRMFWLRRPPRPAAAALTVAREDPRLRALLCDKLGAGNTEVVLAAASAAVNGFGQSPTDVLLDTSLRAGQLFDAVARVHAFERAHDTLCVPERESVERRAVPRPAPSDPVTDYAAKASAGGVVGAIATGVVNRSVTEAANAVLAGSPRPARFGWTAFASVLGQVLARDGVLVRSPDRLRTLQTVDTLLVHAGALHLDRRMVCEANPHEPEWADGRLWQAAEAALAGRADAGVELRPVADNAEQTTGLMIASAEGREVGTVLVGHEPDPVADAVLDAAGQAGLRVVVMENGVAGACVGAADETIGADRSMVEVLDALRADGHVVLTLARPGGIQNGNGSRARWDGESAADHGTAGETPADHAAAEDAGTGQGTDHHALDEDVLDGVLGGDLSVCLADQDSAVLWSADLLCADGLVGVWRLLRAIPAARAAGEHAVTLAKAGAALSGLLVVTNQQRRWGRLFSPLSMVSPVDLAAGVALLSGWGLAASTGAETAPIPRPRVPWHALAADEVLTRVREQAWRHRQAATGLAAQGRHLGARLARLPGAKPVTVTLRLADAVRTELSDPLTPVLAVGAAASAVLGSTVDAILVIGVMGVNAFVGGAQRLRAEHALAALAAGQRQQARLVRRPGSDGGTGANETVEVIDADDLVPGQVIDLRGGDVVPADARLLALHDLEVDESALTGESLPVTKELAATSAAAIADRHNMVFEGTTVVAGNARAVVVDTGKDTETGRAVALASRTPPSAGVQARLGELTKKALPLTIIGGAAVTGLALLHGRPIREAIGGGVAVTVAAVPEGLPLVATVAQMAAARRLSRHGILVRTARTLEALGRVDTMCFDKTGTLTENKLTVIRAVTAEGEVFAADRSEAAGVLTLAARACPQQPTDAGKHAHATDEATLRAAPADPDWTLVAGLPFEASRGYAAAAGFVGDAALLAVKGAPEVVLPACADAPADIADLVAILASDGLRVLAVARRRIDRENAADAVDEPLGGLEYQGLIALADTARPSAAPLVRRLRAAGVNPVVLTGDHPETARAIAIGLGWPEDTLVVTGDELASLDREGGARLLHDAGVVARVAPEQKLQVVEALRASGRVVAMVGDGANDAAAIRAADVGIGIAARGSAAARNAADVVLTDEDLTALVGAVEEGRALWRSVADAISILIGGNAGEVGFTVLGTLLAGASPFSTRQLLLVNLLTDMFPAMAVAVTPASATNGDEHTPVGTTVLDGPLTRQIRQRGITTGLGASTAWLIGTSTPGTARRTSTMALCGLVGSQLVQTLMGRQRSPLVLVTTVGSAAALFAVVQTPGLSQFFGCTPLGPVAWAGVGAAMGTAVVGPLVVPPLESAVSRVASRLPAVRFVR